MDNETVEEYTAKDFGKDVAVETAKVAAAYAIAIGGLLAAGYTYTKVSELRARRAAKKNQTEN